MQVVCGGKFGTPGLNPENEKGETGHNAPNFTIWLAGRGVRVGHTHGKTDDTGSRAVEGKAHFRRATLAKTSVAVIMSSGRSSGGCTTASAGNRNVTILGRR